MSVMNELDQKLRKIVLDAWASDPEASVELEVQAKVEQIKSAFTEAGYADISKVMENKGAPPYKYMTGQAWFDRFEREMQIKSRAFKSIVGADTPVTKTMLLAIDAAKRAAGLEER